MLSILAANPRARWWGLVVISVCGVSLIIVDSTIVNVAVPSIIDDIGITSTQAQWVQEIYTLVFAALLLVFGRAGRRRRAPAAVRHRGRRLRGVQLLAAVAQSGGALIGARVLQGIGGAMILPTSLSLLNATSAAASAASRSASGARPSAAWRRSARCSVGG